MRGFKNKLNFEFNFMIMMHEMSIKNLFRGFVFEQNRLIEIVI